jgi:outer membrane lipoprotein carrier protein
MISVLFLTLVASAPPPAAEHLAPSQAPSAAPAAEPTAPAELVAPPETTAEVKAAVKSMQAFYEKAKDCSADFTQSYVNQAFKKTLHSTGKLRFKKPGMLRFDYLTPEPKFFVVKNDKITSYVPAAQQAMVGSFKADELSASVTFLFGKGNLESEFTIHPADRRDLGAGTALLLIPKHDDPRFSRIYFVVDPATFAVKVSVVIDPSGNQNRFDFSHIQTGVGLTARDFDESLPPGTQIIKTGG